MANIKISELNELETKNSEDLLAIVDTNNNETKKIKVENLINENVELIAVSPTAPSECSLGDKYFNTTSNKLYTAIATDTWSSTGENAVEGILYVVFGDQSTYAYDGTTLVSVGGGSGETITQQPTAPENPEEDDLWIDTTNGNALKRYNGTSWELVSTSSDAPIGTITPFAGTTPPSDYLLCDGTAISRTTYSDLFAVIGTTYGSGDGSTTFNLPNLKGRVPVGLDGTDADFDTIGKKLGSKYLQQHTHNYLRHHFWSGERTDHPAILGNSNVVEGKGILATSDGANTTTGDSGNIQPSLVTNFIIKATKTTPIQAEVVNTQSTSTTDGYSCNYSNEHFGGVVLYDNFTGSTSTITLSDNASNYRFIDIMFQGNNGTTDTTRAYDLTKGINLFTANVNSGITNAWLQFETISFSGNTINRGAQGEMAFGSSGFIELVSSSVKITKVIGYK